MKDKDREFDGLLAASGVPVSDAERVELRKAYSTLCDLADRVRRSDRDWTAKPMPSFSATPRNKEQDP
ncbi:MAG: hypothetical protein CFH41_00028 [Alphaproteobacteria bacterium MarineAlpha11_Bin1]|nr:MAG: hypothetical protein CFH41_00028 [Alphaproteobacteria bacterium MarineAlpha11_Bin1]